MVELEFNERDIQYFETLEKEISCPCNHVFTKVTLLVNNPDVFRISCSKCGTCLTRAKLYETNIQ